jgi:hypothetical protein
MKDMGLVLDSIVLMSEFVQKLPKVNENDTKVRQLAVRAETDMQCRQQVRRCESDIYRLTSHECSEM